MIRNTQPLSDDESVNFLHWSLKLPLSLPTPLGAMSVNLLHWSLKLLWNFKCDNNCFV